MLQLPPQSPEKTAAEKTAVGIAENNAIPLLDS